MATKIVIPNGKGKITIVVNEKNNTATITIDDGEGNVKEHKLKNLKKSKDGTVITADGPWGSDIKITLKKVGKKFKAIIEIDLPWPADDRKEEIEITDKQYKDFVECIKKLKIPIDKKLAFRSGTPKDALKQFAVRMQQARNYWDISNDELCGGIEDGLQAQVQFLENGGLQLQLYVAPIGSGDWQPDLTEIEGIGPKTSALLQEAGIFQLAELAAATQAPEGLGENEWQYFQTSARVALNLQAPLAMGYLNFEDVEVVTRIFGSVEAATGTSLEELQVLVQEHNVQLPAEYSVDGLAEWLG